jgi:hypothetical protein
VTEASGHIAIRYDGNHPTDAGVPSKAMIQPQHIAKGSPIYKSNIIHMTYHIQHIQDSNRLHCSYWGCVVIYMILIVMYLLMY